jgi:hypothetical protein
MTMKQGRDVHARCDRLHAAPVEANHQTFVAAACVLTAALLVLLPPAALWLA